MTTTHIPTSKSELLAEIDRSLTAVNAALDNLTPAQLLAPTDSLGWSAKDHLSHMAAWVNAEILRLQGKPNWEGLGITRDDMLTGDNDITNAAIFAVNRHRTPAEARAFLHDTNGRMVDLIRSMSDEQLARPFRELRADEPADLVLQPLVVRLWGFTAEHYDEHRGWLVELANGDV